MELLLPRTLKSPLMSDLDSSLDQKKFLNCIFVYYFPLLWFLFGNTHRSSAGSLPGPHGRYLPLECRSPPSKAEVGKLSLKSQVVGILCFVTKRQNWGHNVATHTTVRITNFYKIFINAIENIIIMILLSRDLYFLFGNIDLFMRILEHFLGEATFCLIRIGNSLSFINYKCSSVRKTFLRTRHEKQRETGGGPALADSRPVPWGAARRPPVPGRSPGVSSALQTAFPGRWLRPSLTRLCVWSVHLFKNPSHLPLHLNLLTFHIVFFLVSRSFPSHLVNTSLRLQSRSLLKTVPVHPFRVVTPCTSRGTCTWLQSSPCSWAPAVLSASCFFPTRANLSPVFHILKRYVTCFLSPHCFLLSLVF